MAHYRGSRTRTNTASMTITATSILKRRRPTERLLSGSTRPFCPTERNKLSLTTLDLRDTTLTSHMTVLLQDKSMRLKCLLLTRLLLHTRRLQWPHTAQSQPPIHHQHLLQLPTPLLCQLRTPHQCLPLTPLQHQPLTLLRTQQSSLTFTLPARSRLSKYLSRTCSHPLPTCPLRLTLLRRLQCRPTSHQSWILLTPRLHHTSQLPTKRRPHRLTE